MNPLTSVLVPLCSMHYFTSQMT